jgi:hypothetical protein
MDPIPFNSKADEKALENAKKGIVTMVVMVRG